MSRVPPSFKPSVLALAMVLAVLMRVDSLCAQPLLRGAPEADAQAHPDAPPAERSAHRGRMIAEEEQQFHAQQVLEFQREQFLKAAERKAASERMMRYALWTAIAVIALTLLVTIARNRTDTPTGHGAGTGQGAGAGQGRGAPRAETPERPIEEPTRLDDQV